MEKLTVIGDGHLHLYKSYDIKQALDNLFSKLQYLAERNKVENKNFKVGLLMQPQGDDFFKNLSEKKIDLPDYSVEKTIDGALWVISRYNQKVCLIPGRQIITGEKIEVLAACMENDILQTVSAETVIERVIEDKGIPILPWAPGKWMFKRGKAIEKLINKFSARQILTGDTSLRPLGFPLPRLMKKAVQKNIKILAGSDPLPFKGEEKQIGNFCFMFTANFDSNKPMESFRSQLGDTSTKISSVGKRNNLFQAGMRLKKMHSYNSENT
jgi:hypothetical protein